MSGVSPDAIGAGTGGNGGAGSVVAAALVAVVMVAPWFGSYSLSGPTNTLKNRHKK